MNKLRVMLADDHTIVRAGLKALIDSQPDMVVIAEANDGDEVIARIGDYEPDVVVMDLSMPNLNGADATRQLRTDHPQVQVLVLSVHEDPTYLRQVLEAGATGYVLKRAAADSLITAIRQVAEGRVYLDPALGSTLVHTVVGGATQHAEEPALLSEREALVLQLIAHGYSNKEIAGQLHISVKTVETYKARAMEKLGIHSRVEIVRYANARGWLSRS